jgi:Cu2+-containing amine oxidase
VDLVAGTVDVQRIENGQAPIGFADVVAAVRITKEDAGWQAAMRKRGIEDFELVQIDPWPAGGYQHPSIPAGHRAHRAIAFVREDKTDNGYARPVQGLIAHVDLTLGKSAENRSPADVGARTVEILSAAYRSASSGAVASIPSGSAQDPSRRG